MKVTLIEDLNRFFPNIQMFNTMSADIKATGGTRAPIWYKDVILPV